MSDLRFHPDGTFRILQIADVQEGVPVSPDTRRLIEAALDASNPDLVIFTGDQIRGYDPAWIRSFVRRRGEKMGMGVRSVTRFEAWWQGISTEGTMPEEVRQRSPREEEDILDEARECVRECFHGFLDPLVARGIPFGATYGNHDFQCGIMAEEQDNIYREFPGCLNPDFRREGAYSSSTSHTLCPEPGTFALPIMSSDGENVAMNVAVVNSGDYQDPEPGMHAARSGIADADGYGTPSKQALTWLAQLQKDLPVPTIAFQHIAPQEFYDCLREVPRLTWNAVEGKHTFAGRSFVIDKEKCLPEGELGEGIGCPDINVGQVDLMQQAGGYFALYCGHDHKNSFVGHAHGMDLGYTPTCSFTSYGPPTAQRAVRLLEFHEENPREYYTRLLTWKELVGGQSSNGVRTLIEDHCITSRAHLFNDLRRPKVAACVSGVITGLLMRVYRALRRLRQR